MRRELVASIDQNRGALVRLHDDDDLEAFGADLEAEGLYSEPSSRPSSVTSLRDIADAPMIVAIIGALLGSAAIAYGLALTVRRRRQDLADPPRPRPQVVAGRMGDDLAGDEWR